MDYLTPILLRVIQRYQKTFSWQSAIQDDAIWIFRAHHEGLLWKTISFKMEDLMRERGLPFVITDDTLRKCVKRAMENRLPSEWESLMREMEDFMQEIDCHDRDAIKEKFERLFLNGVKSLGAKPQKR